jgi:iron-sulfur cluster assembly protein
MFQWCSGHTSTPEKEDAMIKVTTLAANKLTEYFKNKERQPIRIFLKTGGWGGPSLTMALDEPKETDSIFDIDGFKFIVDQDLLIKVAPITVDFAHFGFQLDCTFEFEEACRLSNT